MPETTIQKKWMDLPMALKHPEHPLSISYVLLYFPHLTETFIANEINAIQSLGHHVRIVSLLRPKKNRVQPLSKTLLQHTLYAPGGLRWTFWKAQAHFLRHKPSRYLALLFTLMRPPGQTFFLSRAKRLVIFFKSAAAAYQLGAGTIHLIHAHFAWLSGAGAFICGSLLEVPYTLTVHAFDIFFKTELMALTAGSAARVVAISKYNQEYLSIRNIVPQSAISVVHCGLPLSDFPFHPRLPETRSLKTPLKILSVGSLTPKKGHSCLIRACQILKDRQIGFICNILGDGKDEAELRELINSCGLQDKVFLKGSQTIPEVCRAYREHDMFVLAAVTAPGGDRDGIPVVIMEAAAIGIPVISTAVSGIPELVRHEKTGLLVPPGEPGPLASAILRLAGDPALRHRCAVNARRLIETEFDQSKSAEKLVRLFYAAASNQVQNPPNHRT